MKVTVGKENKSSTSNIYLTYSYSLLRTREAAKYSSFYLKEFVSGLHQKKYGQQVKGGDSRPLGPQHKKDTELLEQVQNRTVRMISRLEHLLIETR